MDETKKTRLTCDCGGCVETGSIEECKADGTVCDTCGKPFGFEDISQLFSDDDRMMSGIDALRKVVNAQGAKR